MERKGKRWEGKGSSSLLMITSSVGWEGAGPGRARPRLAWACTRIWRSTHDQGSAGKLTCTRAQLLVQPMVTSRKYQGK
eukprot:scaffold26733_cov15-Tisochrysis_lutea.AAC.1